MFSIVRFKAGAFTFISVSDYSLFYKLQIELSLLSFTKPELSNKFLLNICFVHISFFMCKWNSLPLYEQNLLLIRFCMINRVDVCIPHFFFFGCKHQVIYIYALCIVMYSIFHLNLLLKVWCYLTLHCKDKVSQLVYPGNKVVG
jgi:hypothetical protein